MSCFTFFRLEFPIEKFFYWMHHEINYECWMYHEINYTCTLHWNNKQKMLTFFQKFSTISIEIIFNDIIHVFFIFHIFHHEHWQRDVHDVVLFINFDLSSQFPFFQKTLYEFKCKFFFSEWNNTRKTFQHHDLFNRFQK